MNNNDSFYIRKFSHELRNPLTAISCSLQLLEQSNPSVKDSRYWHALSDDIGYMIALLDDFTCFSSEQMHMSHFSPEALIKQVALSFASTLTDSRIEFTSKIDIKMNSFYGDAVKLQEVLRNLLKNAADACKPKDSIYLSATSDADCLNICVQDSGCGIKEELLPTLFEPFITYKKQGSGLGLAICKQIVEAHNGIIRLTSRPMAGTTVSLHLPSNPPHDDNHVL